MECHIDAGRRDDALHVGQAAMQFMKANVPHKCKEIFLLQVKWYHHTTYLKNFIDIQYCLHVTKHFLKYIRRKLCMCWKSHMFLFIHMHDSEIYIIIVCMCFSQENWTCETIKKLSSLLGSCTVEYRALFFINKFLALQFSKKLCFHCLYLLQPVLLLVLIDHWRFSVCFSC